MVAIGIFNWISCNRENNKTFATLKEYLADPSHLFKVVIDNEKGYSEGRIHFVEGPTFHYNNVMKYEESVLSMLESGGVSVLYVHDHVYGLPPINDAV